MLDLAWTCMVDSDGSGAFLEDIQRFLTTGLGVTYPEIYDAICFRSGHEADFNEIKTYIAARLAGWEPSATHKMFMGYVQRNSIPVLTTNYDLCLERAAGYKKFHAGAFDSRFYPTSTYYYTAGEDKADVVLNDAAIWHIHGSIDYKDSIRIGALDYAKLQTKIQRIEKDYYARKAFKYDGDIVFTWLDLFYKGNLVIFGLSLDSQETTLRYLLIQRMRETAGSDLSTTYVTTTDDLRNSPGKKWFLESFGVDILTVDDWEEWYSLFT